MGFVSERVKNPSLAYRCCLEIAQSIEEPILKQTALSVLSTNYEKLRSVKGSDWQHHNFAGGLIVHICNVSLNAIRIAEFYKDMNKVNIDLVKFCSLMHDVGKLFDYDKQIEYKNENNLKMNQDLLGHSFEGASYIRMELERKYEAFKVDKEYSDKVIT